MLDAEQVRNIAEGKPLEEYKPTAPAGVADDGSKRAQKERPSMVPPMPPLNKPLPQE